MNIESVTRLAEQIASERSRRLQAATENFPHRMVYASSIPLCARQGALEIVRWREKKPHDERLQARFDMGKTIEHSTVTELREVCHTLGMEIIEGQSRLPDDMEARYFITGKIDGKIRLPRVNGQPAQDVVFEIKSIHPNFFDKVDGPESIRDDVWMSRYWRQMQMYLLGFNQEAGLLIFHNCLGAWRFVVIPLVLEDAEVCVQTAERVRTSVKAIQELGNEPDAAKVEALLPERIAYDPDVCDECPFVHICLQEQLRDAKLQFMQSPDAEAILDRLDALKPAKDEYEKCNEKKKELFNGVEMAVVGKWLVTGKSITVKEHIVKSSTHWRTTVKKA